MYLAIADDESFLAILIEAIVHSASSAGVPKKCRLSSGSCSRASAVALPPLDIRPALSRV